MSEIKVNKISPRTACGTTTLGDSGDTFTIPSGVSITNQGTASGFGSTGEVSWVTTTKTTTFTVTAGEGYFCDTSSGGFTANLPAGTAGASFAIADYTNTFQTGNLTISANGSQKIGGVADDAVLKTEGQSAYFVYVDDTEGWKNVIDSTSNITGASFITATGGTVTTDSDCKIHTFTGPGTFCVSAISGNAANNQVSYAVTAGGAGAGEGAPGAGHPGGGGGAGGFREDKSPITPYTASPLEGAGAITVTATGFPITVGAGGAGGSGPTGGPGVAGSASIFSTITSAGGGAGGTGSNGGSGRTGCAGGSGGGSGSSNQPPTSGGAGNTPPVSPPQGNSGGTGAQTTGKGGSGGGATAAGSQTPDGNTHPGGAGATTNITASSVVYSAGGAVGSSGGAGTVNSGNGGDGRTCCVGGAGGSGIVIIRYKFQ